MGFPALRENNQSRLVVVIILIGKILDTWRIEQFPYTGWDNLKCSLIGKQFRFELKRTTNL